MTKITATVTLTEWEARHLRRLVCRKLAAATEDFDSGRTTGIFLSAWAALDKKIDLATKEIEALESDQ